MAWLVDNYRSADRHKGTRDRHKITSDRHKSRGNFMDKPLVSVDSEAATDPNGYHRLIMITVAHEDGRHWTMHGSDLETAPIFEWLFSLPIERANWIWYAGMYDTDMWLGSLADSPHALHRIANEYPTRWRDYRITHVRQHTTSIAKLSGRGKTARKVASFMIWDVIGFFQQSFVKTLKDWKIGDEETVTQIENMKLQRSTFSEDARDEIAAYNVAECQLLIQVVRRLITLCQRHDIQLTRLDGAGAAAAALLRRYRVEQYLENPPEIDDIARWALYGGRIDVSRAGVFRNVWSYDINSAYPAACVTMPCWSDGMWTHSVSSLARPLQLGIYRISWDFSRRPRSLCPLPFRRVDGGIRYPATGQGHYWSLELNALTDEDWQCIKILDGWTFTRGCEHSPFGFIPEVYAARRELKKRGDLGHLVLKLPLNALYGKLAQATSGFGKRPRYQSFVAAGYVTAWCRSQIIAALGVSTDALAIATDGILTRKQLPLDVASELGTWEETKYEQVFIVQPGVYALWKDGERQDKTRGANRTAFDFARLVEHWRENLAEGKCGRELFDNLVYSYSESRFYGLKIALTRLNFPWRRWETVTRTVGPGSARHLSVGYVKNHRCFIKFYSPMNGEGDMNMDDDLSAWRKLEPGLNLMSQRYEPKREAEWTEAELLHHYMPDPEASDYRIFDR